jgi:chromosome segregation ATPase
MEWQAMLKTSRSSATVVALAALTALVAAGPAAAQQAKGSGKIVCWKDKAGKVVGCGDTVPPEYQQNASKELDRRGVTRSTNISAADEAKRKEQDQEQARKKAEEDRRLAEQRRQDTALINTYASDKEIDQRRDRDLQQVDAQISQLQASLKNATTRHNEVKGRHDAAAKSGKPVPDALKSELSRAEADRKKIETDIAGREQDKSAINARFAEQKKRYLELTGKQPTAAAAPAPAAAAKK